MNMFNTKEEVDEHVKRILSMSKSQRDKDRQYLTISKMYYDVKEFLIAKNYVDEFMKLNENSQLALKLLAKIHENLSEYDLTAKYYERLYDLYSEKEFIFKASEFIMKSDKNDDKKIKKYISILEKISPNHELYIKLKKLLSPNATFTYTIEEINNLKAQIKSNVSVELKIRFLRILENQTGVVDSLEECKLFMDNYSILDNVDAAKTCLSIFEKFYKPNLVKFKSHYCFILIALFRNRTKICDYDRDSYLLDLLNLLKTEKVDQNNSVIFQLFIYYLTSFVHFRLTKDNNLTKEMIPAILGGYLMASSLSNGDKFYFSPSISLWLRNQVSLIKSISNHMICDYPQTQIDNFQSISKLIDSIWDKSYDIELPRAFFDNFSVNQLNIKSTVEEDIQCLLIHYGDLKLICWQIMCHNKFPDKSEFNYQFQPIVYKFISSISNKIFSKVPLESTYRRSPENISKIDIITFLIGSLLSYQKSLNSYKISDKSIGISFELWQEIRIPEVVHKCWEATCDFTLLGRRNTSIGALKELLKSGLDSMQLIDNQMSESLKLQLGKVLFECAKHVDSERDLLKKRSIAFYTSVIQPDKTIQSFKSLPISTYANSQNIVSRQKSFTHSIKIKEMFDTEYMGDEELNQWKLEGAVIIIDWRLQQRIVSIVEYEDLDRFIESVEDLGLLSPQLEFMKAKIYAARANSIRCKEIPNLNNSEYNQLLKSAQDSANHALDNSDTINSAQKSEFEKTVKKFLNSLASIRPQDNYSIMEFSVAGETCNSNRAYNQSIDSTDFCNQSQISDNQSIAIDIFKIEQLQTTVNGLSSSHEKINSEINYKIEKVSKNFDNELSYINEKIQSDNKSQNELYQRMVSKIDKLNSKTNELIVKTDLMELKSKYDQEEIHNLTNVINKLNEIVNHVRTENNCLKNELDMVNFTRNITENVLRPETDKINNFIDSHFNTIINNANKHIYRIKNVKIQSLSKIPELKVEPVLSSQSTGTTGPAAMSWACSKCYSLNNENETSCPNCIATNRNVESILDIDLSKFNKNKWQCPTCACMNDDNQLNCPACNAVNPTKISSKNQFDLSKFSKNKWECPTCACMNDDKESICPSCRTSNPTQNNAKKIENQFDLSKFSKNKWECPTCACMNDDNQLNCPACNAVNPTKIKSKNQFEISKLNRNNWECPKCSWMNEDKILICSSCKYIKIDLNAETNQSKPIFKQKYKFGSEFDSVSTVSTSSAGFFFGSSKTSSSTGKTKYAFGTSNKINGAPNFGNSSNDWTCECTTANKDGSSICIACGVDKSEIIQSEDYEQSNSDSESTNSDASTDSDVIIVKEQFATKEQKDRAQLLLLPDNFYVYENYADLQSDNDSSNEIETVKQENKIFGFGLNIDTKCSNFLFDSGKILPTNDSSNSTSLQFKEPVLIINNDNENEEENPENFDPDYQPIIALPDKVEVITGEENSEILFNERCKLYKWINGEWKERGIGEMKILTTEKDNRKSYRLVMRREQVHKVVCNHAVVKGCPHFSDMGTSTMSTCWFAEDFSEGKDLEKVKFAIKFKTEELLTRFKNMIKGFQDKM